MRNLTIRAASWAQTRIHREEEGQTVIEYALVVGLVSVVIIATLVTAAGTWIGDVSTKVTTAITG